MGLADGNSRDSHDLAGDSFGRNVFIARDSGDGGISGSCGQIENLNGIDIAGVDMDFRFSDMEIRCWNGRHTFIDHTKVLEIGHADLVKLITNQMNQSFLVGLIECHRGSQNSKAGRRGSADRADADLSFLVHGRAAMNDLVIRHWVPRCVAQRVDHNTP